MAEESSACWVGVLVELLGRRPEAWSACGDERTSDDGGKPSCWTEELQRWGGAKGDWGGARLPSTVGIHVIGIKGRRRREAGLAAAKNLTFCCGARGARGMQGDWSLFFCGWVVRVGAWDGRGGISFAIHVQLGGQGDVPLRFLGDACEKLPSPNFFHCERDGCGNKLSSTLSK